MDRHAVRGAAAPAGAEDARADAGADGARPNRESYGLRATGEDRRLGASSRWNLPGVADLDRRAGIAVRLGSRRECQGCAQKRSHYYETAVRLPHFLSLSSLT